MGPIGCSLLISAVCIAKNLHSFIAIWLQWVLAVAKGTFIAHQPASALGLVDPRHAGSQYQTRNQSGVACVARQNLATGPLGRPLIPAFERGSGGLDLGAILWLYDLG